jgi:hypothetical protein
VKTRWQYLINLLFADIFRVNCLITSHLVTSFRQEKWQTLPFTSITIISYHHVTVFAHCFVTYRTIIYCVTGRTCVRDVGNNCIQNFSEETTWKCGHLEDGLRDGRITPRLGYGDERWISLDQDRVQWRSKPLLVLNFKFCIQRFWNSLWFSRRPGDHRTNLTGNTSNVAKLVWCPELFIC